jgi:hypothetical protein
VADVGFPAPKYRAEGFFTTVLYKGPNTVKKTVKKTANRILGSNISGNVMLGM